MFSAIGYNTWNKESACGRISILCEQISQKCWFRNMNIYIAHTKYKWPPYTTEWYLGLPDHLKFFQGHFFNEVRSVVWRGLVMPGTTAGLFSPPNKFLYWAMEWRMVVNLAGYTLFVTSQYDVILTFGVGLVNFVDTACKLFSTYSPYSLL